MPVTFKWLGDPVQRSVISESKRALFEAGAHVLEEAGKTIPYQEGTLLASGEVQADDHEAVISYDTPYAAAQHEDVTFRHAKGRRAKWLELTIRERIDAINKILADGVGLAFR